MTNNLHEEETGSELPKIHCLVRGESTIIADLVATVPAAILADGKLYYFEVAATSDSTAHAIAGALSEHRVDAQWQLKGGPFGAEWKAVQIASPVAIRDCRLAVANWHGRLHHVAVLDTSGELILADNDACLWAKLRSRMDCPTLPGWGEALMPLIHRSGMLISATSFGVRGGLKAYVLSPEAAQLFDRIVGEHVRAIGGGLNRAILHRPCAMKGAA